MYSTNRCTCSVRALELFVRDFVGLEIHSHPRRPSLARLGTNVRRIGTRPALGIQQSRATRIGTQVSSASSHDDLFVPFDLPRHDQTASRLPSQPASQVEPTIIALSTEEHELGFEPELEIHRDGALEQTVGQPNIALATELGPSSLGKGSPAVNAAESSILDTTHDSSLLKQLDAAHDSPASARSRTENRKERKLRRMSAKKTVEDRAKEEERVAKDTLIREKKRQRRMQAREETTTADMDTASPEALEREFSALAEEQSIKAAKAAEKSARVSQPSGLITSAQRLADERQAKWKAEREEWMIQKAALEDKFGVQNWNPRKRISPDALAGIRALHSKQPDVYTTPVLAAHFKVSAEAIRRILKSKWQPSEEETESRKSRWEKRGEKKWSEMVEQGIRPPKKWREMGVGRVGGKGEVPAWKKASHAKNAGRSGERWIEHAQTDVFETFGDMAAEKSHVEPTIAERIL